MARTPSLLAVYHDTAVELVREAGAVLSKHFGKIREIRQKEHPSSVVCDADLAAEQLIIQRLRSAFPCDSIVAEESGWVRGTSEFTWVVDPLDGTSNFVAGIPWFGAQIGVLWRGRPVAAAMFLPVDQALYSAVRGGGTHKNGKRLAVSPERNLKNTLCAFGFDATASARQSRRNANLLMRVASGVRNTRATNSLVDFCYTIEGRLGGCVNLNCKIWDIVPVSLMLPEAGGRFTALNGGPLQFEIEEATVQRSYQILGATKSLHPKLLALIGSGMR